MSIVLAQGTTRTRHFYILSLLHAMGKAIEDALGDGHMVEVAPYLVFGAGGASEHPARQHVDLAPDDLLHIEDEVVPALKTAVGIA